MTNNLINDMGALEEEGEKFSNNLSKYGERLRVFNINEILRDDLIYIKDEHKKLYRGILTYLKTNVPKNLLIKGIRGTGKTLLTRKFSEKVADKLKNECNTGIHYVNCRDNFRELAVLQSIIKKYQRGVSTSKVHSEFLELTEKYDRNIVILDEVEHLENVDVLYTLTRTPNLIVIATSLTGAILDKVAQDQSVQSTFNPEVIFFGSYGVEDFFKIFDKRVRYVLDYYDENTDFNENLQVLSILLRREHASDLRVGIEALSRLFQNELDFNFTEYLDPKKSKKIYEKYLSASKEKLDRDSLMNLDTTNLIILLSISLAKRKKNECSILDAYRIYDSIVKENVIGKEMTDRAFRKYMPSLQSQEFFTLIKDRRGRSTINYFEIDETVINIVIDRFLKEFPEIEFNDKYRKLLNKKDGGLMDFHTHDETINQLYDYYNNNLPQKLTDTDFEDLKFLFDKRPDELKKILVANNIIKNDRGIKNYETLNNEYHVLKRKK